LLGLGEVRGERVVEFVKWGVGNWGAPKPVMAMPALFTRMSMPEGCSVFRKDSELSMLEEEEMSSWWYLMSVSPPSRRKALAFESCGSLWMSLRACSPRVWSRAVR